MAYKVLIFGTDDLYPKLKPFYDAEVARGNLEIVDVVDSKVDKRSVSNYDLAIISSSNDFYNKMKFLETQGIPRNRIIDGRVFTIPNLDFQRLLKDSIAYSFYKKTCTANSPTVYPQVHKDINSRPSDSQNTCIANSRTIYPQVYKNINSRPSGSITLTLGVKSYIRGSSFEGKGLVSLGNFSSFANEIFFSLGMNVSHNYLNVGTSPATAFDWSFPKEFLPPQGMCKILIGNDVWCGRGCVFKCTNPNRPLTIGNGAVIAADSVVVKNVPPYAIVGGNPAQIIKYRFEHHIIEALLRIKWWDWSLDKIHDNFKYFNDIERFISLHDK